MRFSRGTTRQQVADAFLQVNGSSPTEAQLDALMQETKVEPTLLELCAQESATATVRGDCIMWPEKAKKTAAPQLAKAAQLGGEHKPLTVGDLKNIVREMEQYGYDDDIVIVVPNPTTSSLFLQPSRVTPTVMARDKTYTNRFDFTSESNQPMEWVMLIA